MYVFMQTSKYVYMFVLMVLGSFLHSYLPLIVVFTFVSTADSCLSIFSKSLNLSPQQKSRQAARLLRCLRSSLMQTRCGPI